MRLLSLIKNLVISNNDADDYDQSANDCTVEITLKKTKFDILTLLFRDGMIGYRDIGKYIYQNNVTQINKEIFEPLTQKAENGCEFKDTYVRFYNHTGMFYIEYPLEALSVKKKIHNFQQFKHEIWYKKSIYNIEKFINKTHRK